MLFRSVGTRRTLRFLKLGIIAALISTLTSCDIITSLVLDTLLGGGATEDSYEFDDDPDSATVLDLSLFSTTSSFDHTLTSGDQDWFRMEVPAGYIVELQTSAGSGSTVDTTMTYYVGEPFSSESDFNDDGSTDLYSSLSYTNDTSNAVTLYVVVEGFSDSSTGSYTFEASVDDYFYWTNTSTGFSDAVDFGDPFNGVVLQPVLLGAGDYDYFVIDTFVGDTVTIETFSVLDGFDDVDTVVEVYDYAFNSVTSDDDGGTGTYSLLTFNSTFTDVYYVIVRGFSGTSTGYYGIVVDSE